MFIIRKNHFKSCREMAAVYRDNRTKHTHTHTHTPARARSHTHARTHTHTHTHTLGVLKCSYVTKKQVVHVVIVSRVAQSV